MIWDEVPSDKEGAEDSDRASQRLTEVKSAQIGIEYLKEWQSPQQMPNKAHLVPTHEI
jgi:hypothetical protein